MGAKKSFSYKIFIIKNCIFALGLGATLSKYMLEKEALCLHLVCAKPEKLQK